jgi:DDE superfamily endonuclease
MTYESFWVLHEKLKDGILTAASKYSSGHSKRAATPINGVVRRGRGNFSSKKTPKYMAPPVPNGPIPTSVRLACAIRYFAGGSPYDLMGKYGVSYTGVMSSVWCVVEATNSVEEFHISYPSDEVEQRRIAASFRSASAVEFDNCAGAIDGILIWIQKPSDKDAERSGIGLKKLYCGRKHKFGLNCQAVSDKRGRFLDISIKYGGSSADCMAFEASELCGRLEAGLLATGLVLFGDNAYLNSPYMATPYPNVSGGSKDNYNFYHSQVRESVCASQRNFCLSVTNFILLSCFLFQLRIRVECAFGMFVQRWAILRTPMPINISIQRVIALVNALAKLHNFCIEQQDEVEAGGDQVIASSVVDAFSFMNDGEGFVDLEAVGEEHETEFLVPTELLDAGNHFDEVPRNRRIHLDATWSPSIADKLPRKALHDVVLASHKVRPSTRRLR